jgi:hypothetical protein
MKGFKFVLILTALFSITLSSCRKKADTIAKIIVRDSDNLPVVGADVNLFCVSTVSGKPGCTLNLEGTTDGSGEASFNFNDVYQLGQAGVAVLNIKASKDGSTGNGIIKIEQEVTSEETIFLP